MSWNVQRLSQTKTEDQRISEHIRQKLSAQGQSPTLVVLYENKTNAQQCVENTLQNLNKEDSTRAWQGKFIACGGIGHTRENILYFYRGCAVESKEVRIGKELEEFLRTMDQEAHHRAEEQADNNTYLITTRLRRKLRIDGEFRTECINKWAEREKKLPNNTEWFRFPIAFTVSTEERVARVCAVHCPGPDRMLPDLFDKVYLSATCSQTPDLDLFVGDFNMRNHQRPECHKFLWSTINGGTTQNKKGEQRETQWDQALSKESLIAQLSFPTPDVSDHASLIYQIEMRPNHNDVRRTG